jgi:hypothetical protein
MTRTLFVLLAFCLLLNHAQGQHCSDIRHFDFKNATIIVGLTDDNELQTVYNSSRAEAHTFRLRDGVAETFDDPSLKSGTPDWRAELLQDREVHPEASTWIRVIVFEDDHLTGTGTWHYVLAFGCNKGRLTQLFRFTAEGVSLAHLDDQTLELHQGIWSPSDSHADPSMQRVLTYKWNEREHRYRRVATVSGDGAKSKANEK